MPRPQRRTIQLTIDGREVQATEGVMLVDAAKYGDVEIPTFCYEPKLGNPVGACRMCLVEIEGIPKLQTACSTPVKDGMIVHTTTDRVKQAQNTIVEFLLVNHPLDCPVCDKGGECPLQDITFGWGLGRSRVIEPKRHFVKPLALSPLVAIDRERCILCYRCVRFSQEIAEDWQLIFSERGAHTFVGTHDGHPYVAPFSGNIIELCPVGALTSQPYRFRARPWDIESAGGICTLCPSQCNVTFTVRDEMVLRVLARDNHEVDDGWLCDKGRFAYQAIHVDERITRPMVREGGFLREVSWERALDAAKALGHHAGHAAALAGGQATNEEGFLLQRLMREALRSNDIDSSSGTTIDLDTLRALASPARQATVPDIEFAHTVLLLGCEPLDDAPILDLRIRKGVRRNGVKLAIASARPSALDRNATLSIRYAPREEAAFLAALEEAMASAPSSGVARDGRSAADATPSAADATPGAADATPGAAANPARAAGNPAGASANPAADPADDAAALAALLRDGGEDVVILWGERLDPAALQSLLRISDQLGLVSRDGAGLLEIPAGANGRGLREAGVVPNAGPGYADPAAGLPAGRDGAEIARAAADGEIRALYLLQIDPVRELPDRALWNRALHRAGVVVAHASVLTEGLREHADVIFPAESSAEKEGTVVHPDGRLQRLRVAIEHPDGVRPGWGVITEVARRNGLDLGVLTAPMVFGQLVAAVPFYEGLTLEEIGGRGVRWPAREQAAAMPAPAAESAADTQTGDGRAKRAADASPPPTPSTTTKGLAAQRNGALRLGTYRPIWAAPEVEISPALQYTIAEQTLELSPSDAARLGILDGERVEVAQLDDSGAARSGEAGRRAGGKPEGTRLHATARVRTGVVDGTAFLAEGIATESANALTEPLVEVRHS